MPSETEVAGMGYIFTFFNDMEQLTNTYASYSTIMLTIKEKYPNLNNQTSETTINESDRHSLIEVLNNLRFWITRVHTKAMALKTKIPELEDKNLNEIFEKIDERTVVDLSDIKKYVFTIHECFVKGALEDLLVKITDLYPRLIEK